MSEILLYHSISDNACDPYATSPLIFETEMKRLSTQGYKVLSLWQFYEGVDRGKIIILTFDDGYKDFFETVVPILNALNFSATVFILAGLIGSLACWRKKELQSLALLGWDEIHGAIDAGHEIGSHGLYHRNLNQLPKEELREEIFDSKRIIEENTRVSVESFSYPFCKNNKNVRNTVQEAGYKQAVGCGREYTYDFKVNRFRLWRKSMRGKR